MGCDKPSSSPSAARVEPFRQFPPPRNVDVSSIWSTALAQASPCRRPQASVQYYSAPPWLLDELVGLDANPQKRARFLHHWVSIRTFCRVRLFDGSIQGRPLTVLDWRHALWGDYDVDEVAEAAEPTPSASNSRQKYRHGLRIALRRLFGKVASLPGYREDTAPRFGNVVVTKPVAADDRALRQRVVHDLRETNWRCEILSLDALMVESGNWSEAQRWAREFLVSRTWGDGTSGIDIAAAEDIAPCSLWRLPPEPGWQDCLPHHEAFVEVLSGWPDCPQEVRSAARTLEGSDSEEYTRILVSAVAFYVRIFTATYGRLPIPPACIPPVLET